MCGLLLGVHGPAVRQPQQQRHQNHGYGDEKDFVPTALVGKNVDHRVTISAIARHNGTVESSEFVEKVQSVIEVIRPIIQQDDGDIALRGVDEQTGVVQVELFGACITCPASSQTLKAGVERILVDRVEGVTEVVNINEPVDDGTAVSL